MLADVAPEMALPADRIRPLGNGRYELKALIDADCQQGLEHGRRCAAEQLRGLLSHVDPRMTTGQLVGRIVAKRANACRLRSVPRSLKPSVRRSAR